MSEPEIVASFDYASLDAETRRFVEQKTDEIHGQLKRTAEGVIRIGQNLRDVKERIGHGHFLPWLQAEFALTPRSAQRFIEVAEKFEGKYEKMSYLPITVLYELAASSTSASIIQGVMEGEIPPTLQMVREAKKAEQQALSDKEALQHLLQQERSVAHTQIIELTTEIERIQQDMSKLSTPQIREIPVIPEEVTQQIDTLRSRVQTLTQQRDTLSKHVEELGEQVRATAMKREEIDEPQRHRLAWQETTNAFQSAVLKVLSGWPSSLDTLAFEASDWNRAEHLKAQCLRLIEECNRLRDSSIERIIDSPSSSG